MPRKNPRNTKGRIIAAAWKLFYEQGYEDTTIEDIVFESETSKGSFYHYFDGKDALVGTLSTQLLTRGEKHLLDRNRTYFKLLRKIIAEGQRTGQLRGDRTVNEIVKAYALWERALLYDWCLCGGEYSLVAYTDAMTPMFLESWRGADQKEAAE